MLFNFGPSACDAQVALQMGCQANVVATIKIVCFSSLSLYLSLFLSTSLTFLGLLLNLGC